MIGALVIDFAGGFLAGLTVMWLVCMGKLAAQRTQIDYLLKNVSGDVGDQ